MLSSARNYRYISLNRSSKNSATSHFGLTFRVASKITEPSFDAFAAMLIAHATTVDYVPHVFDFERDPDDAHYVDLAVAVNARLIVSRDNDLLSLNDKSTAEGKDFRARFPEILILTPRELLSRLEAQSQ
jgi:predicted nucleic acid-binding protein